MRYIPVALQECEDRPMAKMFLESEYEASMHQWMHTQSLCLIFTVTDGCSCGYSCHYSYNYPDLTHNSWILSHI